ncbi:PE-PPE domain-containing protein [Candidatus Mycobacterium wuenschmannii]|uniref:PE-PPE domain-containing protein n=1 Tax=Candidatus Mycobacterium wuenschmannii TaxID=3027808 RepID=A0ABY8W0C4_9MYCO|nr:PE-PPE domain-containing protein [Candidatus Mycobacterium wuenschmannii]WIM89308.1 PE-PPE domain-containing protein [Candidatus Mycobacterium wuenschmannii]
MTKLAQRLAALASVIAATGCNTVVAPVIAHADGVTYTVEPFDYDSIGPMNFSVTQKQLGGSLCPCAKVPYPADGLHNDKGVAALVGTAMHPGDTVAGFSLGAQVISLYLAHNTPPAGVRFVLLGDTFARNDELVSKGEGIPPDIANHVILVARQYDGWSDSPTRKDSPHYKLALQNAQMGAATIHDYVNAHLDDPANVVTTRGNITAILIPTQRLPLNGMKRMFGSDADDLDAQQRPLIDSAYDRPSPTAEQLAASSGEQR